MSVWWSVGLTAAGITGWWLAGSGPRWAPWGWAVAIAVQPFWIAFAILGRQWGFILAGFFYAAVAARNWHKARRPQHGFAAPAWDETVDDPRAIIWRSGRLADHFDGDGNRSVVVLEDRTGHLWKLHEVALYGVDIPEPPRRVEFTVLPGGAPWGTQEAFANAMSSLRNSASARLHLYDRHVCPDERHACPNPLAADPPALVRPLEGP